MGTMPVMGDGRWDGDLADGSGLVVHVLAHFREALLAPLVVGHQAPSCHRLPDLVVVLSDKTQGNE